MQRSEQRESRRLYLRREGRDTMGRCLGGAVLGALSWAHCLGRAVLGALSWAGGSRHEGALSSKPKDGVREATHCRD